MKDMKGILSTFVLLIVAGMLITFATRNIISDKREELYAYQDTTSEPDTERNTGETTSGANVGPMANIMTKEKYLEPIATEEDIIADLWSGISDDSSAMRVVLYELHYWDDQLDKIFQMYYEIQSVANIDIIKQEEASFIAERTSLSQDAAKAAGETFKGLEYSKEYVRLTKEKTYELIDRYFAEE